MEIDGEVQLPDNEDDSEHTYNWNLPNFEALNHVSTIIKMLGPPKQYSTLIFEAFHLQVKHLLKQLNNRYLERDLLVRVSNSFSFH